MRQDGKGSGCWIMPLMRGVIVMISEKDWERIEAYCLHFQGQLPDLFMLVGLVVAGPLFGWRVVRLVVSRRIWTMLAKEFGDPKVWMPERGKLAYKSQGLKLVEQSGDFWGFIRGSARRKVKARDLGKNLAV